MHSNMYTLHSIVGATDRETKMLDEVLNLLPHGYKFYPDDAELIEYYLQAKIAGYFIIPGRIHDVDIYKHSPQQLNDKYKREGEQHTFFFTPRSRKYPNGNRPDRAVGDFGFWKATGRDNPISSNGTIIGFKKTLVFYEGKPRNAVKTNWIMQEFTLNKYKNLASSSSAALPSKVQLDDWVLCKIYKNKRERESQDIKEMTLSTKVVTSMQDQPNQLFPAQHMQTPPPLPSSSISETITYSNSFLPPSSLRVTPLDEYDQLIEQINFDDNVIFLDFEQEGYPPKNQFFPGPILPNESLP